MEEAGRRCSVVRAGLSMRMRWFERREERQRAWVSKKRLRSRKESWHGPVHPSPGEKSCGGAALCRPKSRQVLDEGGAARADEDEPKQVGEAARGKVRSAR